MPIYEFRCLQCDEIFELLFLNAGDQHEMTCPHCGAQDLTRVMSVARHAIAASPGATRATSTTKNCATGSCTTLEIPGHGD